MKKILFFTGTRAEYGLLRNLILKFQSDSEYETHVVVSGTHLSATHGMTIRVIQKDQIQNIHPVDLQITGDSSVDISSGIGNGIVQISRLIDSLKPDLLVLLGDRYELWTAAISATMANIPIAHIHGGESTEGVIDEAVRHSITKMAHLHFCSNVKYRERILQMGEQPSKVWDVGAPGLDRIKEMTFLSRKEIQEKTGASLNKKNILCTFHPVTLDETQSAREIDSVINAIETLANDSELTFFITYPNSDTFSSYISESWKKLIKKYPSNVFGFVSLGDQLYLSLMNEVDVVIGNSSSGIYEAPFFKKPVVDIGKRQLGRLKSHHILHSDGGKDLVSVIQKALSSDFKQFANLQESIYGDGNSVAKIYEIIKHQNLNDLLFKKFFDN